MEVAALAACLNTMLPMLWDHRKEKKKERIAIQIDIEDIRTEIHRLDAAFEDAKFKGDGTGSAAATELKQAARESSQQMHDSMQRFFIIKKDTDWTAFAMTTKAHKEKLQDLCQRLEKLSSEDTVSEKPQDPFVADPMDMGEPKKELLELVKLPGSRPSEGMRKVISIVGFGGLGKTLLAKLIYDHDHPPLAQASSSTSTPDCTLRAWVTAAAKKPQEVLREIHKQLDAAGKHGNLNLVKPQADTAGKDESLKLDELGKRLAERLRKKRYFIVIDDMQSKEQWNFMNDAFPKDGNGDGTIIVTTTIKSVADACSSGNGYVYKLPPLDKNKSLDLFFKDRIWDRALAEENIKASDILNKCEGLPLAIVSMSQSLKGPKVLTSTDCEVACNRLGADLVKEKGGLKRLRWVLMNKYTGLAGYNLRACLLYFCMYKHNMGAVPKRNSLIRRWEAEGFLVEKNITRRPTDVGAKNLETLVDRNIIQPMEVGINGTARRCRPPGMMLEYISHRA